jgi:hypothetical protein
LREMLNDTMPHLMLWNRLTTSSFFRDQVYVTCFSSTFYIDYSSVRHECVEELTSRLWIFLLWTWRNDIVRRAVRSCICTHLLRRGSSICSSA